VLQGILARICVALTVFGCAALALARVVECAFSMFFST
jgi:hypothetical protein